MMKDESGIGARRLKSRNKKDLTGFFILTFLSFFAATRPSLWSEGELKSATFESAVQRRRVQTSAVRSACRIPDSGL